MPVRPLVFSLAILKERTGKSAHPTARSGIGWLLVVAGVSRVFGERFPAFDADGVGFAVRIF